MAKYVIEYDRNACIGAGVCAAVAPDHWVMAKDGKANLVDPSKKDVDQTDPANNLATLEIDEKDLEVNKQAAEGCPAVVIHIKNKDTGEKVF